MKRSTIIAGCLTQAAPPCFYLACLNPEMPGGSGINFIQFQPTLASADRALERFKETHTHLSIEEIDELERVRLALHASRAFPPGNPEDREALDQELVEFPFYTHGDISDSAPFLAATSQEARDAIVTKALDGITCALADTQTGTFEDVTDQVI